MKKSELLDSLDLSSYKPKPQIQNKKQNSDLNDLLGLPEENSEDEEDDIWKNTIKNGKLEKK